MFEYDKFYRECQQQNKPFIKAKTNPAHGNYYVQIDLATCDYKLSDSDKIKIKKFLPGKIKDYNVTSELAWFDGISSDHLDDFCTFLYDLTQNV